MTSLLLLLALVQGQGEPPRLDTVPLNPRVRRLLERAPRPPRGQPGLSLIVSADTVRVGEQVDVVTAAWFPRDLRLQLRRPPTLQPPVIDGVWTYPQALPAGIAATRNIGGVWYDLFVAHQIVYPLVAGSISVPQATLKYSTPLALQFFSREERFVLTSAPARLVVRALPAAGRPAGFAGAIGSGLRLERRVVPPLARVGEGVAVEYRLSGEGNTALWPAPEVRWPPGARAYAERVEEQVAPRGGRLAGTKIFRFLVVPDSVGALRLPGVSYPYFDLAAGRYLSAGIAAATLPVAAGGESAVSTAMPPELLPDRSPSLSWRLAGGVPDWAWLVVLALPPLAVLLRSRVPERRRRRPTVATDGDALREAEERLEALIRALVPNPDLRAGAALAAAVRAAGADAEVAGRVAAARERLLARRYGPDGGVGDDAALAAEVNDVVHRLAGSQRSWQRRVAIVLLVGVGLYAVPGPYAIPRLHAMPAPRAAADLHAVPAPRVPPAAVQAPSPEAFYKSGALHVAAEGFAERAAREPAVAAHWYNLGAAYYRLGEPARARAAWLRAQQLDPREPAVRRALRLTPSPDAVSSRWTWAAPVTPEELLLVGTLGWLVGWLGWVARPRARDRWAVLLILTAAAALAGLALRGWYRRPVAVVLEPTQLRLSPHGRAPAVGALEQGGAVLIRRESPGWVLVRAPGDREGWLPVAVVAAVGG